MRVALLDQFPEATQERLMKTLTSWLRHFGSRREESHIHPASVGFGDRRFVRAHRADADRGSATYAGRAVESIK